MRVTSAANGCDTLLETTILGIAISAPYQPCSQADPKVGKDRTIGAYRCLRIFHINPLLGKNTKNQKTNIYWRRGARTQRNPRYLPRFEGSRLKRHAERRNLASLTKPPPRTTRRYSPFGGPEGLT